MAHQVTIPAAGESINSASVGQWHKADGEMVRKGDLLATIETDKVSTELEAEADGILKILVQEGEEVAIGTLVAEIEEGNGEAADSPTPAADPQPAEADKPEVKSEPKPEVKPAKAAAPAQRPVETVPIKVPPAGESITSATIAQWHKRDRDAVTQGETLVTLDTDKVSAELEAEASGVLTILSAEGTEVAIGTVIGNIAVGEAVAPAQVPDPSTPTKPETALPTPRAEAKPETETGAKPPAKPTPQPAARSSAAPIPAPGRLVPDLAVVSDPPVKDVAVPVSDGRTTRKRMSMMRRKIAAQLVGAQQTAAILTTFNEVDMSAVMALRKTVQDAFVEKHGVKLGFMSFFVKAVVQALEAVPSVNGRIDGDEIVQNHFYDIGIAVGTEKGLVVPVVREADQKSPAQIELDILDYATRARDGKIQLEDLQGGVFTISNGGIYGSLLSTPIVNPPQSGILGMHTIQQRPVAVDGEVVIRPMMYLALSYDHRLVDGKEAVTFLIKVKEGLESPARLMLGL